MNQIFKKIHNENAPFYINAKFESKAIELVILQRDKAWKCSVIEDVLNKWCTEYQMSFIDYYNTLKEYLNNPPINVNLSLDNNEFVIYRSLSRGRAKFFLSSLEETDYPSYVENRLLAFHNENQEYKSKISTLEAQQKQLETTNREYAMKLQEFIERKDRDDEQLYSNFVQVLNEKKRKIQHLTELLEAFRNGRSTIVNPSPVETKRKKDDEPSASASTIQRKEVISESEEESSCEQIEEEMQEEDETTSDGDNQSDNIEKELKEESINSKTNEFPHNIDKGDDDDFVLPKRVKNTDIKPVEVDNTPNSSTLSRQSAIETISNEKQQPTIDTQELLDMV